MRFPAPAKLNLFLHVLSRRDDGYHNLQTIFALLDYGDELEFMPRTDGELRLRCHPPLVSNDNNLVLQAAQALRSACGEACAAKGADIVLHKRIPLGSGLGGGSSDAATTLQALNQVWTCGLSDDQLVAIAEGLGADVSVFLYGRSAWGEGRGDELKPVTLPAAWYMVLVPPVEVSTAAMFADLALTQSRRPITIRDYQEQAVANDFEAAARVKYPEIEQAMTWLNQYGSARLSGTGAAVFAEFADERSARSVFARKPEDWFGFVASNVQRSPLSEALCKVSDNQIAGTCS